MASTIEPTSTQLVLYTLAPPSQVVPIPITSSQTSSTTSRYISDIYQGRLDFLYAKREPSLEGVPRDFNNYPTDVRDLQRLGNFTISQFKDLEKMFDFQQHRSEDLLAEEENVISNHHKCMKEELSKIDSFHDQGLICGPSRDWQEREGYVTPETLGTPPTFDFSDFHLETSTGQIQRLDAEFVKEWIVEVVEMESTLTTETEADARRLSLESKLTAYISDAQNSRVCTLNCNIQNTIDFCKFGVGKQMNEAILLTIEDFRFGAPELMRNLDKLHGAFMQCER